MRNEDTGLSHASLAPDSLSKMLVTIGLGNKEGVKEIISSTEGQKRYSREEENELLRKWQEERDFSAREKVVGSGIRLVVYLAIKNSRHGIRIADMIQEGCLGLLLAADRFDAGKGVSFYTYAEYHIIDYIRRYIRKNVSLTHHNWSDDERKIAASLKKAREYLEWKGRDGTNEEIAELLDVPVEKVDEVVAAFSGEISMDFQNPDDDTDENDCFHHEVLRSIGMEKGEFEQSIDNDTSEMMAKIKNVVEKMKESGVSDVDKYIIDHRILEFDEEKRKTFAEISSKFGMSKQGIDQREKKIIWLIQKGIQSDGHFVFRKQRKPRKKMC